MHRSVGGGKVFYQWERRVCRRRMTYYYKCPMYLPEKGKVKEKIKIRAAKKYWGTRVPQEPHCHPLLFSRWS